SIAHRQGLKKRQDQVRARPRAPDGQRLPEVLAALLDLPVLRGVEQPADAEGAVDEEPRDFAPGATPLALEQAVGRTLDEPNVVEAVRDQHLKGLRDRKSTRLNSSHGSSSYA